MAILDPRQQERAFQWLALVVVAAALVVFVPLWAPLVLAAWVAMMARPLVVRIARALGGRGRAAGVLVLAFVVSIALPLVATIIALVKGADTLVQGLMRSSGAKSAFVALVSRGGGGGDEASLELLKSPQRIMELVESHGGQALHIASGIAGAATKAIIGLCVFLYALYVFLVDGPDWYRWLLDHAPFDRRKAERMASAFNETGRGLFVGVGLTGLAQGVIATVAYLALGVPRALVLGMLTCLASVIPSVGTALVWVPIAIGLALSGRTGSAAILVGVGVLVIGTVDNVLRPVFARFGRLELPSFVLLVSIFGGLALFGTWGLLLGPLFGRLAKEALVILREERATSTSDV